jgi:glutamyl-tRNA synthetase
VERSTKASEDALMRDLKWLGLDYDEGPDKPGDVGPYRQSERTHIYKYGTIKLHTFPLPEYGCLSDHQERRIKR